MLITGLRGNGKTLKAVGMMHAFVAQGVMVFASNFNGLNVPGVEDFADPRDWESLPPGSVLFVDEAQRFWRARAGASKVPAELTAMETQRHLGIRIVCLTQQPTFLDKHLRSLVDVHTHLVRRAGLPASQTYTWERCKDEPENPSVIELADAGLYQFETKYYGTYQSAEQHYIKPKMPMRLKLMIAALGIAVAGFAWAVSSLRSDAPALAGEVQEETGAAEGAPVSSARSRRAPMTATELVMAMQPRLEGAPWSAPIFDDANELQPAPELVCAIGHAGEDALGEWQEESCSCITTQGTRYYVKAATCRRLVETGGMLNPYKPAPVAGGAGGAPPAVEGAPAPAVDVDAGVGDASNLQQPYGAFRPGVGANP